MNLYIHDHTCAYARTYIHYRYICTYNIGISNSIVDVCEWYLKDATQNIFLVKPHLRKSSTPCWRMLEVTSNHMQKGRVYIWKPILSMWFHLNLWYFSDIWMGRKTYVCHQKFEQTLMIFLTIWIIWPEDSWCYTILKLEQWKTHGWLDHFGPKIIGSRTGYRAASKLGMDASGRGGLSAPRSVGDAVSDAVIAKSSKKWTFS